MGVGADEGVIGVDGGAGEGLAVGFTIAVGDGESLGAAGVLVATTDGASCIWMATGSVGARAPGVTTGASVGSRSAVGSTDTFRSSACSAEVVGAALVSGDADAGLGVADAAGLGAADAAGAVGFMDSVESGAVVSGVAWAGTVPSESTKESETRAAAVNELARRPEELPGMVKNLNRGEGK